jgi:glutamyl-tRNA synthetase
VGAGKVIHPVRSAVSGRTIGPSLFGMMAALGRERLLARLDRALVEFPAS